MISIVSLLVLACMQHVMLYYKSINGIELAHQDFYQLEHLAMRLMAKPLIVDSPCVLRQDLPNQVLNDLIHSKGCTLEIGNGTYRYVIEDLGIYPCLIYEVNQQEFATAHYRISVLQLNDKKQAFLQIRYLNAQEGVCVGNKRRVNIGVTSWRYLPSP